MHPPLARPGRLGGVLGALVERPVLALFDPWPELALGGTLALEFVDPDHTRDVGQALEEFVKELLCGALISAALA